MKKIKLVLPIIVNICETILYKFCSVLFLEERIGYDYLRYADGTEEFRFGIGNVSLLIIVLLFAVSLIWMLCTKKLFNSTKMYLMYFIISMIIVLIVDTLWIWHYIDWYRFPIFYIDFC